MMLALGVHVCICMAAAACPESACPELLLLLPGRPCARRDKLFCRRRACARFKRTTCAPHAIHVVSQLVDECMSA